MRFLTNAEQVKRIVVGGSLNMDTVVSVEELPRIGQTVTGTAIEYHPGGRARIRRMPSANIEKTRRGGAVDEVIK